MKKTSKIFLTILISFAIILLGVFLYFQYRIYKITHSVSTIMTAMECSWAGGRVVNTLGVDKNQTVCSRWERQAGLVSGLRCPCVCCLKNQGFTQ